VFINECRRRLLQVKRLAADGTIISNEELSCRCRLPTSLQLLSRRIVNFVTKMIVELACKVARALIFAEIAKDQPGQRRRVGGRVRSSFLNVLALDVKYLYSDTPGGQTLDELLTEAQGLGIWRFKQVLKALKPDAERGCSLKLVSAWPKQLTCPVESCVAKFAEQKEVNRHIRKSHPNTSASQAAPLAAAPLAAGGDEERRHA
jgi:hypothetical protein